MLKCQIYGVHKYTNITYLTVYKPPVQLYRVIKLSMCLTDVSKCFTAMSNAWSEPVLLDSVLVKPAETLCEIPAQGDGEDIDEAKESKRVKQHNSVCQERQSCEDNRE